MILIFFPVMGLTLDMDHKNLYWIVRGSDGSNLYKAPMAGYIDTKHITVEKVANLRNPLEGPLSYFHNRLLWLQDDKTAVVSDLLGQNIATLKEATITELTTVYVVDPTLHQLSETGKYIIIKKIENSDNMEFFRYNESRRHRCHTKQSREKLGQSNRKLRIFQCFLESSRQRKLRYCVLRSTD